MILVQLCIVVLKGDGIVLAVDSYWTCWDYNQNKSMVVCNEDSIDDEGSMYSGSSAVEVRSGSAT